MYFPDARHNFRKYNSFSVSDFGVGYDYDSVLHYSRKAFSTNGQDTLVPKQVNAQFFYNPYDFRIFVL